MKSNIKIIICILTVVLAFGFVYVASARLAKPAEKVQVVIVNRDIEENQIITNDMVSTDYRSIDALTNNSVVDVDSVVGKYASSPMYKGDIVNQMYLADTNDTFDAYVLSLSSTHSAYSISLSSQAQSVSAHLHKYDIVSVYSYNDEEDKTIQDERLKYVKVIGIFDTMGNEITSTTYYEDSKFLPATIVLEVNSEQAKLLNDYENRNTLHLALEARADDAMAQSYLDAQNKVFAE